jgi:hypothetical protein
VTSLPFQSGCPIGDKDEDFEHMVSLPVWSLKKLPRGKWTERCMWAGNGTPIRVSAEQTGEKLLILRQNLTTGASPTEAPDTTLSANFLNPLVRQGPRVQLLDSITGEPRAMKIREVGAESITLHGQTVETQKYQYTYLDDSTDTYSVWYNGEGLMVMMKNMKDEVTFTLMPVARFPAQLGPPATNAACSQDFPPLADLPGALP